MLGRLAHAAGEEAGEQTPVPAAHLAHAYAVDDGIGDEVEDGQEVDDVELDIDDGVGHGGDVEVRRDEVEHHVGQPEDNERAPQQQRRHERLVVALRRLVRRGAGRGGVVAAAGDATQPSLADGGCAGPRRAAPVAQHLPVDAAVEDDNDDYEAGEQVGADLQRAHAQADGARRAAGGRPVEQQHRQPRHARAHHRHDPRAADHRARAPPRHARRREDRVADGDVLVDGEHQQAEEAGAEREDERRDEHDADEETVRQRADGEAGEDVGRVVVHPEQRRADDVARGQVAQQRVVDRAPLPDATHRQQREGVEEEAAGGDQRVGHEARRVHVRHRRAVVR